jgi:parvulin-like peptidyl-prolyl isomerase
MALGAYENVFSTRDAREAARARAQPIGWGGLFFVAAAVLACLGGRRWIGAAILFAVTVIVVGCDKKPSPQPGAATTAASAAPEKLSPELRAKVLAKVGKRTITLGEYAATLERMDEFERLRYQSPERRKKLLDEMIKAELLAQEAERRGLHEKPETQARLRQMLRDELLSRVRNELPKPADLPESEVRRYYTEHRAEFRDPERRRVAHIVLASRPKAEAVLEQARSASPSEWGKLVKLHSLDKSGDKAHPDPPELAGDLGIVSNTEPSDNPRVPEAVRKALFEIERIGGVYPKLVESDGKFHILRMIGKTEARDRTFAEAERAIRVAIVQRKIREREKELENKLRADFPVKIDNAALAKVRVPDLGKEP